MRLTPPASPPACLRSTTSGLALTPTAPLPGTASPPPRRRRRRSSCRVRAQATAGGTRAGAGQGPQRGELRRTARAALGAEGGFMLCLTPPVPLAPPPHPRPRRQRSRRQPEEDQAVRRDRRPRPRCVCQGDLPHRRGLPPVCDHQGPRGLQGLRAPRGLRRRLVRPRWCAHAPPPPVLEHLKAPARLRGVLRGGSSRLAPWRAAPRPLSTSQPPHPAAVPPPHLAPTPPPQMSSAPRAPCSSLGPAPATTAAPALAPAAAATSPAPSGRCPWAR
jgi:hypothetical protein